MVDPKDQIIWQQQQVIQQLEGEIERLRDHLEVLAGGLPKKYDEKMKRYQDERNEARNQLAHLTGLIAGYHQEARQELEYQKKHTEERLDAVERVVETKDISAVPALLHDMALIMLDAWGAAADERDSAIEKIGAAAANNPALVLDQTRVMQFEAGRRNYIANFSLLAYWKADAPHIVCADIMEYLAADEYEAVTIAVMGGLNDEWIQQHVDNPPAKKDTLAKGLITYQKYLKASNYNAFDAQNDGTGEAARTIRKYQPWYKSIQKHGTYRPEKRNP